MNHQQQHDADHLSFDDLAEDPQTISDALVQEGWEPVEAETETFIFNSGGGARLTQMQHSAQWSRYRLSTSALRTPGASALLAQNSRLCLPAKFMICPSLQIDCVVDVPLEALTDRDFQAGGSAYNSRGLAVWAHGLTGALTGALTSASTGALAGTHLPARHMALEQVAQSLGRLGWTATVEEPSLEVHLQLTSVYRRIRVEPNDIGYRVCANLLPLAELSSSSAKAIRHLALDANRRLPLVRFSEDVLSHPPWLVAEVYINVALVPDVWLVQALSAVEAAVTTTSRELLALRDPELARMFLAGTLPAQPGKE